MRWFGEEVAEHLRRVLLAALREHENVLAVTHVPPFREAGLREGRVSDDDWLPYFACRATGETMAKVMTAHPHKRLTVLCGHTQRRDVCGPTEPDCDHGRGRVRPTSVGRGDRGGVTTRSHPGCPAIGT